MVPTGTGAAPAGGEAAVPLDAGAGTGAGATPVGAGPVLVMVHGQSVMVRVVADLTV